MLSEVQSKGQDIISQIPKINQLETLLEIQEDDAELNVVKQKINKTIKNARSQIEEGNKKIRAKVGAIPDAAKVLTEGEYQDQMSFILKH